MTDDWIWGEMTDLVLHRESPVNAAYEATVLFPTGERVSHRLSTGELYRLLVATGYREAARRFARTPGGDFHHATVVVGDLVQADREGLRIPDGLLDVARYRFTRWRHSRREPTVHTLDLEANSREE